MFSFKAVKARNYEVQFESILKKSTFINEFNSTLKHFYAMPAFENAAKQLINSEYEKLLSSLAELRDQIDQFKEQNNIGIEKLSNALEKSFDRYNEQQEKFQTELTSLFLQHFSNYFKETHPLSSELLDYFKIRIPLQLAELGIQGHAKDQLDVCIELLETHVPLTIDFKNALEILKNFYEVDPEISQFIFIAHEEAFLLLGKRIKNHLAGLNIELIKKDYDNHQALFSKFYRESMVTLINYYQDYKNITEDFKSKFDLLKDVGTPTKDWTDDYQRLSSSATFFSQLTPQGLKSTHDELLKFKQQLNWENSAEFLQKIKKKAQAYINNQIESLEQQFKDYQTRIDELTKDFSGTAVTDISHTLQQILQSRFHATKKRWVKRQERLANIKVIEELKNFKNHFPKEDPFQADLDFKKLRGALSLLEKPHPDKQSFPNIPTEELTETIFFILETLNSTSLANAIDNLLQFIHSGNSNSTLDNPKTSLAIALQAFFNRQPEKLALCLAHNAPDNTTLDTETYEKLINILRYTNFDKLVKWSNLDARHTIKIKELPNPINQTITDEALNRLISTKKILLLFETKNTPGSLASKNKTDNPSLWDACCLFKEFVNHSLGVELPYLKLKEDTKNKDIVFTFQEAVMNLDWFITSIQQLEKQSYSPTLFLKSGKNKQEYIGQLINKLKNIPITQVDTAAINNTFECWKKDYQHLIDEPRYRLLIKLCMLIYRQFLKLFRPESDCLTTSHQTINKLQKQFLQASQYLQKLSAYFTPSVKEDTDSVNETATRLTCTVR